MITDVKVTALKEKGNTLAIASVVISNFLKVDKIKVMNGSKGPFISMPSYKNAAGEFKDLAYPITAEARKSLNELVLAKYNEISGKPSMNHDGFLDDKVTAAV